MELKPERNESCAVNHSLPHRSRGEMHAESYDRGKEKKKNKQKKKIHNTPLTQIYLHLTESSADAPLDEGAF